MSPEQLKSAASQLGHNWEENEALALCFASESKKFQARTTRIKLAAILLGVLTTAFAGVTALYTNGGDEGRWALITIAVAAISVPLAT